MALPTLEIDVKKLNYNSPDDAFPARPIQSGGPSSLLETYALTIWIGYMVWDKDPRSVDRRQVRSFMFLPINLRYLKHLNDMNVEDFVDHTGRFAGVMTASHGLPLENNTVLWGETFQEAKDSLGYTDDKLLAACYYHWRKDLIAWNNGTLSLTEEEIEETDQQFPLDFTIPSELRGANAAQPGSLPPGILKPQGGECVWECWNRLHNLFRVLRHMSAYHKAMLAVGLTEEYGESVRLPLWLRVNSAGANTRIHPIVATASYNREHGPLWWGCEVIPCEIVVINHDEVKDAMLYNVKEYQAQEPDAEVGSRISRKTVTSSGIPWKHPGEYSDMSSFRQHIRDLWDLRIRKHNISRVVALFRHDDFTTLEIYSRMRAVSRMDILKHQAQTEAVSIEFLVELEAEDPFEGENPGILSESVRAFIPSHDVDVALSLRVN